MGQRVIQGVVLTSTFVALIIFPKIAHGGLYQVGACTESVGYKNNSWSFGTSNPTYIEAHTGCGEEPVAGDPPYLRNIELGDISGSHGVPVGTEGNWRFVSPPGTMITEVTSSVSLGKVGRNTGWNVYLESEGTTGQMQVGATCETSAIENECFATGVRQMTDLNAKSIVVGTVCNTEEYEPDKYYTTCPRGNEFGHAVRAGISYATVTISDPIVPTNVAGTQISAGPQQGVISIVGSAVDSTAGLLTLSAVNGADEVVGGPVSVPGVCNYSFTTPCPTKAEGVTIPIDTTKLPNGQDQVRIEATNAAHDEGFSSPYTITVENTPPKKEGGTGYPSGGESGSESKSSGSNLNGSNYNSGNSGSSQVSSGSHGGQLTPVTNPPLPALQLKTKATRSSGGGLLISGLVSRGATGTLDLVARVVLRSHRVWTYKAKVAIEHGRFRLRVHLSRKLDRQPVKISLSYPGSLFFGPAQVSLVIRARHGRTGG